MKNRTTNLWVALALLALCNLYSPFPTAHAQGTAFTYQGQLVASGTPANGSYDLTFSLFDASASGSLISGPLTNAATAVSNGLFTVSLDFDGSFSGADRWLQLGVRTNGGGAFIPLTPRQKIAPTPYAIFSAGAATATTAGTAGSAATATSAATAATAGTANNFSGILAGDVTGTQGATIVSSIGGQSAANVAGAASAANAATSANTPGAIVKRDVSGNFSAGTITASSISASGGGLTNLNYSSITNPPAIPGTNGFVTASITNGLATIAYVNSATNGFVTAGVTNGLASNGYVNQETNRAQLAEFAIAASVTAETTRASNAEAALTTGQTGITANLNAETNRAQTAEIGIASRLNAETNRAQTAESGIAASVASETSRATAAESALNSTQAAISANLNTETNRAQVAEAGLAAGLGSETSRATAAETTLTGNLTSELTRATAAETALATGKAALNGTNTFTGTNTFAGVMIATNANNLLNGTFTGNLTGNVTGSLAGNAATATTAGSATTAATASNFSGPLAGDVTGTQGATVVASVGGQTAANVAGGASAANAATSANTPGTIVRRDGSGNFSVGGITAGSVSAGTLAGDGGGVTNLNGAKLVSGSVGSNQLASGAALANLQASGQSGVASGGIVLSTNPASTALLNAGYLQIGRGSLSDSWMQKSPAPIASRAEHAAIWTGSKMIIWGGYTGSYSGTNILGDGAVYDPTSDTWTTMPTNNAPSPRRQPMAVWTGTEVILWGGYSYSANKAFSDGARYNPQTGLWAAISTNGAPSARTHSAVVWTGSRMVIWGGWNGNGIAPIYFGDGAGYDPATDTWAPITSSGAPSSRESVAVWSGSELITWGGWNGSSLPTDGARYNPVSNSWSSMTAVGAPSGRTLPLVAWTGTEMIIFGGNAGGTYKGDGARYNPTANSWTPITTVGAPSARTYGTAVWTGSEFVVWGGFGPGDVGGSALGNGAIFDVGSGNWFPVTSLGSTGPISSQSALWTGSEMLIFGGGAASLVNSTYSYSLGHTVYLYSRP